MRIALVYRSFGLTGSLPRFSVELARYLSRRHDVHVFSIAARTEQSLAPGCTFHDVPVAAIGGGGGFCARELLSFARNASRLLQREQFDVVHARAPSTWVGDVLHLPGLARGEAELQGLSRVRFAASTARHPGNAARVLVERRALANRGLCRVHVDAPSVRDDLERLYGIGPEHVLVAVPGVNLEEFRPAPDLAAARAAAGIPLDASVLLFCGHDFERKGLDRAIEALAAASSDVVLLVAGQSPAERRFRELAAARGVAERVRFLGVQRDTPRLYHAADLLLLPTRADVWGVTTIEAMACGVPPIVTAAAGSASAVSDGENGIVLPEPFDVRALRDAIDRLIGDPERRASMGHAAAEAARAFTWEEHGRHVEADLAALAAGDAECFRGDGRRAQRASRSPRASR